MRAVRCTRPPVSVSATGVRPRWPVPPRFAQAALALSAVAGHPTSLRAPRPARRYAPSPDARLAAERHTATQYAKSEPRSSRAPPSPAFAAARAWTARARACADDDDRGDEDGDGAPSTAAADIVPQITFDRWTASPMRVLGVSAVAEDDERLRGSTDIGAVAPERPDVTTSDTRDDHGDRSTAPTMIACLISTASPNAAKSARTCACTSSADRSPRASRAVPSAPESPHTDNTSRQLCST